MSDRTCSVDGCERPVKARDVCSMHYQRLRTHGVAGSAGRAVAGPPVEVACTSCGETILRRIARRDMKCDRCKNGSSTCGSCGMDFVLSPHSIGRFCSVACSSVSKIKTRPVQICLHCGTEFTDSRPSVKRQFCSTACCNRAKHNTFPMGGRVKNAQGYASVKVDKGTPGANSQGWILEHRHVMAEALGRHLYDFENVHHLNGVRDDNRIENLELWTKPQPIGQRPSDLVEWAVTYYPELVEAVMAGRDQLRLTV